MLRRVSTVTAALALMCAAALAQQSGDSRDARRDVALEIGRSLLKSLIEEDQPATLTPTLQPDLRSIPPGSPSRVGEAPLGNAFPGMQPPDWRGTQPRQNVVAKLGQGNAAGYALTQRLGKEVDDYLDEQVRVLRYGLQQIMFTDQERDKLIQQLNGRVSRQYLIELQDALIDEDPDAVNRAAKKAEYS
ncbi:MAG: hypothetical protein N2C14_21505 [Planctomycetales bacterium]